MYLEYLSPRYVALIVLLAVHPAQAEPRHWTLESSLRQAMQNAPELKKSLAEIRARREAVKLSDMWPDPSIDLRVDNKLGKDDGSGGYDLTDVVISQPIPLSRTSHQRSVAEAKLMATQYSRQNEALQVQNRVSKVFHGLQLASAELSVAEKRLQLADEMEQQSHENAQGVVVRYLSPLEKMRLKIIREEASQDARSAEGKYEETLSEFRRLLVIEDEKPIAVTKLQAVTQIPDITSLFAAQGSHAQLASQKQQLLAAKHQIDVADSSQLADPTISLIRTRDTFFTGREDVYGVMVNFQIPLHGRKSAAVSKATNKASEQRIELDRLQRDLHIELKTSHTHLNHVVEQAKDYQKKVLSPAARMLELTKSGFTSGELNMLNLVDANNTYFEARLNYLALLYQARVELADLRLYAGQLIVGIDSPDTTASFDGSHNVDQGGN